ncbi:FxSxx-COOH system tetratricopeptide repeat protein [Parafrankia elaeagni]|uniref:FxSxx-COOH system tetratricopeptide repeat protein n=1 Tax=Parafrankia elaeagni TaxID=222534 RepID=UPI0018A81DD7|nr:FxSxx-COOH system tetratricopeptide repeat protein [Parafrankia elaeagni]
MREPPERAGARILVSYAAEDRAWAEWLGWMLEEDGFLVFVACWDDLPGTRSVGLLDSYLRSADRTIVLLSEAYLRNGRPAEWQTAWAADPDGRERSLLVVRIDGCEDAGLLGQIVPIDLFAVDRDEARRRLRVAVHGRRGRPDQSPPFPGRAARVAAGNGDPLPPAGGEPMYPGSRHRVWNAPPRVAQFVGRDDLLAAVAATLGAPATGAPATGAPATGTPRAVALVGLGGVGKSSLALEYVYRHADEYDVVWWVPAEPAELISGHLATLGEALGLPRDAGPAATIAALGRAGRWLLVFDNADRIEDVAPFRPPWDGGHLLVTSRQPGWGSVAATVDVPVLRRAESVSLLAGRLSGASPHALDQIAELLGDLALAVEQAAAFLQHSRTPAEDFAALLPHRLEDVTDLGEVADRPGQTVANLWDLSVRRLSARRPGAVELLELLAFVGDEPVPLDLFTNAPDRLGDGPLGGDARDPVAWVRTVGDLVGHGLADRTNTVVKVHRLVRATSRRRIAAARRREACLTTLLGLLRAAIPQRVQSNPDAWPRWRALFPHVQAALDRPDDQFAAAGRADLSWLCDRAAGYLREQGLPAAARPYAERALAHAEALFGPTHPEVASCLNNNAMTLLDLGRPAEALPLARRALDIALRVHGEQHSDVAVALNNLAGVLRELGAPRPALGLLRRALAIDRRLGGDTGPDIAARLCSLAQCLRELGRFDDALPLARAALRMDEDLHGAFHPVVAGDLAALADITQDLGRPAEGEPLARRALAIDEGVYHGAHPIVAIRLNSLAGILQDLGRLDEARAWLERALAIDERVHGAVHPAIAVDLNNLAQVLQDLGRLDEARAWLERALAIDERVHGAVHPAVASDLQGLAHVLQDLGRLDEARRLLERAVSVDTAVHGPDHPVVARRLRNLAGIYQALGWAETGTAATARASAILAAARRPEDPTAPAP